MSRRTIPNQRKAYKDLRKRLNGYTRKIVAIYSMLAYEAAEYAIENGYDGEREFHFNDYPRTKKKANSMFQMFRNNMQALIYSGITDEWKRSNVFQDQLANGVLKTFTRTINNGKRKLWYDTNSEALDAFKKRKTAGLTISQRLWNDEPLVRANLERALTAGITKGVSAVQLSKRVTKYLNDYSSLSRDYRKKCGKAIDISGCEYRSVRLARNEINLAYRAAEQERWKKMDYIKGKSIHTTQNGVHKADMCDALAGDYPKDFQWTGWHVNCMCYAVPIVMTEQEYYGGEDVEYIKNVPKGFSQWLKESEKQIEAGKTLPSFLSNNDNYADYQKYKADRNYKDVILGGNLGVKGTNINHGHKGKQNVFEFSDGIFSEDELEYEFQDLAFKAGNSVFLLEEGKEYAKGKQYTSLDMLFNRELMDIASITENKEYYRNQIIKKNRQISRYRHQQNPEVLPDTLCLYFHDAAMFKDEKIVTGYKKFKEWCKNGKRTIYLKNIMCGIKVNDELVIKMFTF